MKKKWLILSVLIIISLFTASIVGAKSKMETKPVPPAERHSISEIIDSKSKWEKVASGNDVKGRFMEGINFDKDGKIWMVSPLSKEILTIDGDKVKAEPVNGGSLGMPVGTKFHSDGRLFITDVTGVLHAYDTNTKNLETVLESYQGNKFTGLNDLVFDKDGGLYFTEPAGSSALNPTGRVFYLPPGENSELELFEENIAYPNGIALSKDGQRVYISEFDKNRIIAVPAKTAKASPESAFVFATFEGGIGPDGLTVDNKGNLYVAHFQAGEIVVLDASGFKYGIIRLPEDAGTFVTNLTIKKGYLYITESSKNEVWRIKIKKQG